MAVKSLFLRPKMEMTHEFCLQISICIFKELPHTLLIEPIGLREEVFSKNWIFRVLRDSLYDFILPYSALNLYVCIKIFRKSFLLAKSCGHLYLNFFKIFIVILMFDWIGAREYCGQSGNIGYCGPIWLRNGPKI